MYSESDIDAAVTAGAISAQAAGALRAFVASTRAAPTADEEPFRLLTGFNDIFVAIAALLLLAAVGRLAGIAGLAGSGLAVAALSWGLAEFFTRRRRMALPSIVLLLTFAAGVAAAVAGAAGPALRGAPSGFVWTAAIAGGVTAGAVYLHWRRFRVPVTVAIGAVAAGAAILALAAGAVPGVRQHPMPLLFVLGALIFALALGWDASDRARTTRRSDVAFWLHLAAAPLLVHPLFAMLGLMQGGASLGGAASVIGIYAVLTVVALLIDRRALLVSALIYVLYAMVTVLRTVGGVDAVLALAGLAIGALLVLLSAFWHAARRLVVAALPAALAARLPPV